MCGDVKWRGQSQHFGKTETAELLAEREMKCAEGAWILKGIFYYQKKTPIVSVLMKYAVLQNLSFHSHRFHPVLKQAIT